MSESRLDTLRRQVEENPASPTFAALAEECRKAGLFEEAIETARAALDRFPTYVSARVALGRALIEVGHIEEARAHLETVVDQAPENLAAINALAELHKRLRQGDVTDGGARQRPRAGRMRRCPPLAPRLTLFWRRCLTRGRPT